MENTLNRILEQREALEKRIHLAFRDVPYPGDDNLISTPEHRATCEECHDLYNRFRGIWWRDTLEDDFWHGSLDHAMSFFTASAWQYYLPAYLTHELRSSRFLSLYFGPADYPDLSQYERARTEILSVDQCAVIVDYLSLCVTSHLKDAISKIEDKRALDRWEQILAKKKLDNNAR